MNYILSRPDLLFGFLLDVAMVILDAHLKAFVSQTRSVILFVVKFLYILTQINFT